MKKFGVAVGRLRAGSWLFHARFRTSSADSYFGPGGLSARQIFEKVNESRAKEAAHAAASDKSNDDEEEIQSASSKTLRDSLIARNVDVSDCFERSCLVTRARMHPVSPVERQNEHVN